MSSYPRFSLFSFWFEFIIDTGDYFPEGYDPQNEVAFSDGMLGSQSSLGNDRSGPALPGMEVRNGKETNMSRRTYTSIASRLIAPLNSYISNI
jgi:hypothetical protein